MGAAARSNTAPNIEHRLWNSKAQCKAIQQCDCAQKYTRRPHRRKAARVKQRPRPTALHLPGELWHRIASHLLTKEWAGASGTCRQLRQLQLEHLNITAKSAAGSISAVLWLAKQLPGARSIVLDGWPLKSALQEKVAKRIHSTMRHALDVPQSLTKLTVLSVRLDLNEDEGPKRLRCTEYQPHTGINLAGILANASTLSKLELACWSTLGLPSLAALKHLALRLVRFPTSEHVSRILYNMPLLETLQLSHPSGSHTCSGRKEDALLVVPASVQRVELINVYPEALVLESVITVVKLIGALCLAQRALENWTNVRGQLKGMRLYDACNDSPDDDPIYLSDVWDCIAVLQFIRGAGVTVDVDLHQLPHLSLGNLTSLHVKMVDLCITIPGLPGLRDLRLHCSRNLCLSFEDAQVSAEKLAVFEFVYAGICADTTWRPFWAALKANGKVISWQRFGRRGKGVLHHKGGPEVKNVHYNYKHYSVRDGSRRAVVSDDPWEDLFTPCGCEGCLAGLGHDLKWTSREHVAFCTTSFEGFCAPRREECKDDYIGCPCGLHRSA